MKVTIKQPMSGKRSGEGGLFRHDRVDLRAQEEAARAASRKAAPAAAAAGKGKGGKDAAAVFTDDEELNVLYGLLAQGRIDMDGADVKSPEAAASIAQDSGVANMTALPARDREELWQQTEYVNSAAYERVARLPPELKGRVAFVENDLDFAAQTDMDLSETELERLTRHGAPDNLLALTSKRGYGPSSPLVTDARARVSGLSPAEIAAADARALADRRFAAAAADIAARELGMPQDADVQRRKRALAAWKKAQAAARLEGRDLRYELPTDISSSEAERLMGGSDGSGSGSATDSSDYGGSGSSSERSGSDLGSASGEGEGVETEAEMRKRLRDAVERQASSSSSNSEDGLGDVPSDPSDSDYERGLGQSNRRRSAAAAAAAASGDAAGAGAASSGSDADGRVRRRRDGEGSDDSVSSSFEDLLPENLSGSEYEEARSAAAEEKRSLQLQMWARAPAAMALLEQCRAEERAARRAERAAAAAKRNASPGGAPDEASMEAELARYAAEAREGGLSEDEIQELIARERRRFRVGINATSSSDSDSDKSRVSESDFEEALTDELAEKVDLLVKAIRHVDELHGFDPETGAPPGVDVENLTSHAEYARSVKLAVTKHFKLYPAKLEVLLERRRAAREISAAEEAQVQEWLAFMRTEGVPEGDRAAAAVELDEEASRDYAAAAGALAAAAAGSSGAPAGSAAGAPASAGAGAGAGANASLLRQQMQGRQAGQDLVALMDMTDDETRKKRSAAAKGGTGAGTPASDAGLVPGETSAAAAALTAELQAIERMPAGPQRDAAMKAALAKLEAPELEAMERMRRSRRIARDARRLKAAGKAAAAGGAASDSDDVVDLVRPAGGAAGAAGADAKVAAAAAAWDEEIARAKSDLRAAVVLGDAAAERAAVDDLTRLREERRVRNKLRDPLSRVLATRPTAGLLGEDIGTSDGDGDEHAAGVSPKRRVRFSPSVEMTQTLGFEVPSSADEDEDSEEQRAALPLLPKMRPSSLRSQTALRAEIARAYVKGYKASNEEDDAILDEQLTSMLVAAAGAEADALGKGTPPGPIITTEEDAQKAFTEAAMKMAEIRAVLLREMDAGRRMTLSSKLRNVREERDRAAALLGTLRGSAAAGGTGKEKDTISLSGDDSSDWGGDPADARFLVDRGQQLRDYKARMGAQDTDEETLQLLDLGRDDEELTRIAPAFGDDLHRIPASVLDEFGRPYEFDADEDEAPYPDALTVRGESCLRHACVMPET